MANREVDREMMYRHRKRCIHNRLLEDDRKTNGRQLVDRL
jgi:hypothetical protein